MFAACGLRRAMARPNRAMMCDNMDYAMGEMSGLVDEFAELAHIFYSALHIDQRDECLPLCIFLGNQADESVESLLRREREDGAFGSYAVAVSLHGLCREMVPVAQRLVFGDERRYRLGLGSRGLEPCATIVGQLVAGQGLAAHTGEHHAFRRYHPPIEYARGVERGRLALCRHGAEEQPERAEHADEMMFHSLLLLIVSKSLTQFAVHIGRVVCGHVHRAGHFAHHRCLVGIDLAVERQFVALGRTEV